MTRPSILVVEDNPITRKMMHIALESGGYPVLEAADGAAAKVVLEGHRVALALLDYVLPDTDGLQLLEDIRMLPGGATLPVIVVTGMVSLLESLQARAGAFTSFLAKPIQPSHLLEVVNALLAGGATPTESHGHRVLVVDDEPLNRKLAALRLRDAGFDVETAEGGVEALEKALESPPDAIFSDVLMPGIDGFLLCAAVRKDPRLDHVPVVLCSSAYVEEQDRQLALEMGASALLVRTPDLRETTQALLQAIRDERPAAALAGAGIPALHQERLQAQLDKQTARNEALVRQGAIQAAALSVFRGLSEAFSRPQNVPRVLGDVLVHCLDSAGLSTGLLYVAGEDGVLRLQARAGLSSEAQRMAAECFGHPDVLRRVLKGSDLVCCGSGVAAPQEPDVREFAARLGHRFALLIPFVVFGEGFGVLVVGSDTQDLSEPAWLGFARSLAAQFGQTLAMGRALYLGAAARARYQSLMEHANDAILVMEPGYRVLEVNRQAEALLGRPRGEIVGHNYMEFVAPEERAESAASKERLAEELTVRNERRLTRPDGARVAVEVSASFMWIGEEAVVLAILRDIGDRKKTEQELRDSRHQLHHVLTSSPAVMYALRVDSETLAPTWVSENMERLLGYTVAEASSFEWWAERLHPDDRERVLAANSPAARQDEQTLEYRFRNKDGSYRWIRDEQRLLRDDSGRPVEVVGSWSDVTEKSRIEAQLVQAQKMEAIGRLAGGIAHDFNNLLGVILGYSELLGKDPGLSERSVKRTQQILKSAERAAGLTRQLLAFSRKQPLTPKIFDLNELLADLEKMLRRLIGEDVRMVTVLAPAPGTVRADPGQIEQVIVNLVVNTRDAMPRGGRLVLETTHVDVDETSADAPHQFMPGPYVVLAVSDTGHGMDATTLSRLFEPFFTTKEAGKGTGLGLATAFGIVKQSGGHIGVESEPGKGTTFRVYLPHVGEKREATAVVAPAPPPRGDETVLLVEDEQAIRLLIREVLEGAGYTVLETDRPENAAGLLDSHAGPIQLLLTDLVLPGMSGAALAALATNARADMKILFMSGYTDEAVREHGLSQTAINFLQKPFTADALLRKVRSVLDGLPRPS
jgi:PAS domain S-box-containing protein